MADGAKKLGSARKAYWIGAGILAIGVLAILAVLRPMAPRRIDIFAGPRGSAYHATGVQLADELGRHRITARVVETNGAVENLRRLGESDTPAVALAQSGSERAIADSDALADLVSLGSVAFEPVWLFVRNDADLDEIADLAGHQVGVGLEGSGSRALADLLLEANGLTEKVTKISYEEMHSSAGIDAILAHDVDALFIVGGTDAKPVDRLLRAEGVHPVSFARAEAYAVLFPGLARFDVPSGVVDLAGDIPEHDLETLAATTNLVASEALHGAMVEVLIDAARDIQVRPTLETPAGVFPSMNYVSLPLSRRARHFYQEGPSKLSRVLPYWASALADQLLFVVIPALAVLVSLLKVLPLLLGLRYTMRDLALTRRMVSIERDSLAGKDREHLWAALDEVDRQGADLQVPRSKSAAYLALRQNIHDARERIQVRAERASPPEGRGPTSSSTTEP